jgi:AraC-like DNA-binding protein
MVRNLGGAYVRRVIDRSGANVAEHAHDWPVLSIFVLGGYRNQTELGEVLIAGGVNDLAREVKRHPSWLGTAYRRAIGEGLTETAARLRVERAARLLRETDQTGADVAQEAGFCDQSHMNRTFRRLLGRLPSAVRNDRTALRQ